MRTLLLFLMAGLSVGCTAGGDQETNGRRAPGEPAELYARRMIFVGGGVDDPNIVVFDHTALADPAAVERSADLWHATESGWQSLLELRWTDAPIREPWRLVPNGPLRVIVGDAGEVEALRIRDPAGDFLLHRIASLGEWNRDDPAIYRIDLGEWGRVDDVISGLVVDIHPSANGPDTIAPGAELVLTDGAEFSLIATVPLVPSTEGAGELWVQYGERQEAMNGVRVARDTLSDAGGWIITVRSGELEGELEPIGVPLELERSGLHGLRGWVTIRGERHSVFGVMRRATA